MSGALGERFGQVHDARALDQLLVAGRRELPRVPDVPLRALVPLGAPCDSQATALCRQPLRAQPVHIRRRLRIQDCAARIILVILFALIAAASMQESSFAARLPPSRKVKSQPLHFVAGISPRNPSTYAAHEAHPQLVDQDTRHATMLKPSTTSIGLTEAWSAGGTCPRRRHHGPPPSAACPRSGPRPRHPPPDHRPPHIPLDSCRQHHSQSEMAIWLGHTEI